MAVLHKGFIRHPKFSALSDGAFRLWMAGWAYCQEQLTDGIILKSALPTLGVRVRNSWISELISPVSPYGSPLWRDCGNHYEMHDFLDWNDSRHDVQKQRKALRNRVRRHRERRYSDDGNAVSNAVTEGVTGSVSNGGGTDQWPMTNDQRPHTTEGESADRLADRAGAFVRWYQQTYSTYRNGAAYLLKPSLDYMHALKLVTTYPDDDWLHDLALIYLQTDHRDAKDKARTIGQFTSLAPWCDQRLREAGKRPSTEAAA